MAHSNGNGHPPALAFAPKPSDSIPIVGQPFTIKGWFPTVLLVCNCDAKEALMIPRGGGAQCPGCKRIFSIQQIVAPAGVTFGIGMMTPDEMAALAEGVDHG
jgi:hypothetical protein